MTRRWAGLVLAMALALAACSTPSTTEPAPTSAAPAVSWAPQPRTVDGLTVLASPVGTGDDLRIALHTSHGDVTFWGGVNLGSTTPGHNPGELSIPADDFRRWFPMMAQMGIHFVRVYTILPPHFYDELAAYNTAHPDAPLYLVQGVYLPDELAYITAGDLYDKASTAAFTAELQDASAAVSGDLVRPTTPGRASGTWTTDVSPWLAGWIIGAEMDPVAVSSTDDRHRGTEPFQGDYFAAVSTTDGNATPSESWLAARMDELATAEAARGRSVPIAFVNWPTTDPLEHDAEPYPHEDLVGLDANRIQATSAWPGGTFASYHVYPFYPDFIRLQPEYQEPGADGQVDAYRAYLQDLVAHHAEAGLATMATEFGVPASIGAARTGSAGRDQGRHSEAEALALDADMLQLLKQVGMSGAMLFIWSDEWFKGAWNTFPRTAVADPERRALWHDPLTNEQWYGVLAQDPVRTGWRTPVDLADGLIRSISVDTDASFAYLRVTFAEPPQAPFTLRFDIVPGAGSTGHAAGDEVQVRVDPQAGTAQALVRHEVNPLTLDGLPTADLPPAGADGWDLQQLTASRAFPATDGLPARPAQFVDVGNLVRGTWDPSSPDYDSLATWSLADTTFDLRLPWSMLLMGDPSSKVAVVPRDGQATAVPVESIGLAVDIDGRHAASTTIGWEAWNAAQATERVKAGADAMSRAWHEVSG